VILFYFVLSRGITDQKKPFLTRQKYYFFW